MKNEAFFGITGDATEVTAETAAQEASRLEPFVALVGEAAAAVGDWPSPGILVGSQPPEDVAIQGRQRQLALTAHALAMNALEAFSRFLVSRARDRTGRVEHRLELAERDGETHLTKDSIARIYSNFNGRELGHAQASAVAASAILQQLEKEGAAISARRAEAKTDESERA